jgi:hypothetical protein
MAKTVEIHPAIGIARVGSSRLNTGDGYFIGPEPETARPNTYRDPAGYLKRQAARFRLFICDRDDAGRLLHWRELDLADTKRVTWTVHLANRKGVARRHFGSGPGFRNGATCNDEIDAPLIINPGVRCVSEPGELQRFDSGHFRSTRVPLGEIGMEPDGRLFVLGGFGQSGSDPPQQRLTSERGHFADNNDWFDDTSDGPITASVEWPNGEISQATAWVIVGPPDFAPSVTNLVTLYDVLFDLAVRRGVVPSPTDASRSISFKKHVLPILERAVGYRWVNRYAELGESFAPIRSRAGDRRLYSDMWLHLAGSTAEAALARRRIVDRLRNPDTRGPQPIVEPLRMMPRISDSSGRRPGPGYVLPLTATQYQIIVAWADGHFENDFDRGETQTEPLPDALDRVSLENCVGGPFYPGIEVNRFVVTDPARFEPDAAFRLSHEKVRPGEVTQQNALPWQADFLICRWEEFEGVRPRRLAWWPGSRPDDVLTTIDSTEMVPWDRGLGGEFQDMVDKWDRLGLVVDRGTPGDPCLIETERDTETLGP